MILLPLGFGTRLPSFPAMCIILALAISAFSAWQFPYIRQYEKQVEALEKPQLRKLKTLATSKICLHHTQDAKFCKTLEAEEPPIFKYNRAERNKFEKVAPDLIDLAKGRMALKSPLRNIPEVNEYLLKDKELQPERMKLAKNMGLLNRKNLTIFTVILANFSHGGWLHLIGNMLALVFLGVYLEARIGAVGLFATFMLSGLLGLAGFIVATPHSDSILLGASAGVAGIMGAYLVLFFAQPMRVWMSYFFVFNRVIMIPSFWILGSLFVVTDIVGAMAQDSHVAHLAHLIGLGVGIGAGLFFKIKHPIPKDMLYPDEVHYLNSLKATPEREARIELSSRVLSWNPNNTRAMQIYLRAILTGPIPFQHPVADQLTGFLAISAKKKQWDQGLKVLNHVPSQINLSTLIPRLSIANRLGLAHAALRSGQWVLAVRLYDSILYKKPSAEMRQEVLSSIKNILTHVHSQKNAGHDLQEIALHSDSQIQRLAS